MSPTPHPRRVSARIATSSGPRSACRSWRLDRCPRAQVWRTRALIAEAQLAEARAEIDAAVDLGRARLRVEALERDWPR